MGFRYLAWTAAALIYIGLSIQHGLGPATLAAGVAAVIGFSAYGSNVVAQQPQNNQPAH